jgi:hypothetical protein
MSDTASIDGARTDVEWVRSTSDEYPNPMVIRTPYAECKLEHPALEPTSFGRSFFPDAVPYGVDSDHRVFYWRPGLREKTFDPSSCAGVCATTNTLWVVPDTGESELELVSSTDDPTDVVVDGTVAGDSTTVRVRGYETPEVAVRQLSTSQLELLVDGVSYTLRSETRRRISLPERTVDVAGDDEASTVVVPKLVIRFPGEREVHHPAPDGSYRLFPSFGLDLGEIANPLAVPTANGELDDDALANLLGVDLSARPYPERVLWQAFAYTAFDPHTDASPRLLQFPSGHLAVDPDDADGA